MSLPDCLAIYEDAEFYDMEFAARSFELPFFRAQAQKHGSPILEVACGTGRLTIPLAQDGHDITGLDISAPMLARAREKSAAAGLNIEWLHQDCSSMQPGKQFALIFSATSAMQHLLTNEAACHFLRAARTALLPHGTLILDVFNPDPARLARPYTDRYHFKTITPPGAPPIRVETASYYNTATQILHFDLFYLREENGHLLRTKRVDMRCFFPLELETLCHLTGLEITSRFGDYEGNDFTSTSPKQILLCRRCQA